MKLLSLISICHLAGVIALVTPVLATPLASPRDPIDQSLSEEEYTTIGQRLLQLGVIVSPEEVQFIHQIDSVYDQFRRPGPDVHRVLEAAFNWFRQMTNSDARSQALKVERANDRFVHCMDEFF
ncbi:MAG: hypothetical protein M1826_007497 [Phylliscum demangeonii]|nr:MAG: hypothetical protein M1826_007497 [Phylliscum demangeonii]